MFEMTRETDSFKDESLQSVRWMAQDDEIRIISGTYHKLGYGEHILFAPISKSSWLCQAVISKSIFGADDVAFFYIYCHPFGHTRAQFCQGIMINRSGTYWIDYPSLCFALVAQLLSHRLGFLARTGAATLARPLDRLIFDLVLSSVSETSTRFQRRHSSVGSLTGEALQLLS